MANWPVQDAKARFSEMLEKRLKEGAQIVTKRGAETPVLATIGEWRPLEQAARLSLEELLLAPAPRGELVFPKRGRQRRREPVGIG